MEESAYCGPEVIIGITLLERDIASAPKGYRHY
jgi:hypothetical protein